MLLTTGPQLDVSSLANYCLTKSEREIIIKCINALIMLIAMALTSVGASRAQAILLLETMSVSKRPTSELPCPLNNDAI